MVVVIGIQDRLGLHPDCMWKNTIYSSGKNAESFWLKFSSSQLKIILYAYDGEGIKKSRRSIVWLLHWNNYQALNCPEQLHSRKKETILSIMLKCRPSPCYWLWVGKGDKPVLKLVNFLELSFTFSPNIMVKWEGGWEGERESLGSNWKLLKPNAKWSNGKKNIMKAKNFTMPQSLKNFISI